MEIIVAEHYGFCFGVNKSIAKVNEALIKYGKVYSIGDIIHNNIVMQNLKKQGLIVVDDIEAIPDNAVLIVRAHGLPKEILDRANQKNLKIIDTTCPLVKEVINKGNKLIKQGYKLILIGKPHHPEVKAEKSYLSDVIIVEKLDDLDSIPTSMNFGIIAQTTQSFELFKEIVAALLEKTKTLHIENTICYASILRQKSAEDVAKKVDVMFVIGSSTSSNTTWLYKICSKYTKTFFIEDKNDIDFSKIKNAKKIGITAGASAPEEVIKEVINTLEEYNV